MKKQINLFIGTALLMAGILFSSYAQAATLNVPAGYATIQSAIDAAVGGDTVLVADGTYVENINFNGKAITVQSVNGAASTIIDGNASGSVVKFENGEGSSSVLDGFTLTNGTGTLWRPPYSDTGGGGIYCSSSSPTITNCIISSNSAYNGGGIYCASSSPNITNCTISNNTAWPGAGIQCVGSSPSISNCSISNNFGMGIAFISSPLSITNCTINSNTSSGISSQHSSVSITNCSINDNSGHGIRFNGGSSITVASCVISGNNADGIDTESNSLTITNCTISNNFGDGINCYESSPTITNCTIVDNGLGVDCQWNSSPIITNCTISNNTGLSYSSGIRSYSFSSPTVVNSIIWGNEPSEIDLGDGSINISYSDIDGGYTGIGNITADPQFIGSSDYHLQASSPCIDTGIYTSTVIDDIDGDSRPQGVDYDMGSDEYTSTLITSTSITPTPDNPTPQVGDTVCVSINIADVADLYAVSFDMLYDSTVLSYSGVTEGDFLNSNWQVDTSMLDASYPGQVILGISRLGSVDGVSGSGTLASLCFTVIGSYCTSDTIVFSNAYLEGPAQGSLISATWHGVVVDVMLAIPTNPATSDPGSRDQIDLSWGAVSGAASYEIHRSNTSNGTYNLVGTASSNSYQDASCIIPTLDYYYQVKAISDTCESEFSVEVSGIAAGLLGDINNDGRVDGRDLSRLARSFGTSDDCRADLDRSGFIDGDDLSQLAANFGQTCN